MGYDWETFTADDGHLSFRQGPCKDCLRLRETLWAVHQLFGDIALAEADGKCCIGEELPCEIDDQMIRVVDQLNTTMAEVKEHYIDPYHAVEDLPAKKTVYILRVYHDNAPNTTLHAQGFAEKLSRQKTKEFIKENYGPIDKLYWVWERHVVINNKRL